MRKRTQKCFFGSEVKPEHLNDDALARALEKLYDANPKKVFSTLALKAVLQENIDIGVIHGDTTTRLLFGEYDKSDEEQRLIKIT